MAKYRKLFASLGMLAVVLDVGRRRVEVVDRNTP